MTFRSVCSIVLITALMFAMTGCATVEENPGASVGAGLGGLAGAIIGGSSTQGAIVGGLIGALVGGVIGHYAYDRQKTRDQTARDYNYKPSQGALLTLEDAKATPVKARAGETVELEIKYAVLSPDPGKETSITEIREITHAGQLVGKPEVTVQRSDGTYTSRVPIRLPQDAKKGVYRVTTTVQSSTAKDTKEFQFTVI